MEDKKLVSVVVPVYNVEDYLNDCIEAIVNQTYTNIEIILINDGSTDNSLKICEEWREKDKRISVYSHVNHGVSYTRNFAIEQCNGQYICFIDSDDIVSEKYIEISVDIYEKCNVDLAIVSFCCFESEVYPMFNIESRTDIKDENLETVLFSVSTGMIGAKMYKKEIILVNNLRFDEKIAVTEDLLFNYEYIKHSKTVGFNDSILYGYRQRKDSAVHNTVAKKWFTCLLVYQYLYGCCEDRQVYQHIVYYYLKNLYEANYWKKQGKISDEDIELDIQTEIKIVEKKKSILPIKKKLTLLICKYFFWIVLKKRTWGKL